MKSHQISSPVALTIAGSDSGGGAGIQADLRTFAFHQVHGTSAIACVTAQNTLGVTQVLVLSVEMVKAQIEAVMVDIGAQGVKTGMLFNSEIIKTVAQAVSNWSIQQLVVDPVMVSRTGAKLLDDQAIAALKDELIPKALIVTPNRYEAQILSGLTINTLDDMKKAAEIIYQLGAKFVLVKGGGMTEELKGVDVLFDGKTWEILSTETIETKNNHGTGCTLSAAIAANLALGKEPYLAVVDAKTYVTTALKYSLDIGKGTGPVGHFFPLL
ncbi:bifunctional hydroxymethylpyrimidine kinase/phosphomethylpyrimidine kinase [Crocosphaera sp. UHCC 0190]|uniref:bifunctional hydroxymethylpyrimidine kinase/phosphomethylpyrimidine kinase n=1 Tax=Crocosphaera sp. UHCC 0190 TaxID=3110246 RepID=UPI002B1F21C7|nr:bifunctional hydroxymethylpyrimidine kinase/phosphomethylpyrimidine kinase [Crocosphaera sp. UHCC 0190]MEA5509596.1 bifunctional hydroxymethylpyrimidine kinase/phosphomethylpyrimidine kinase [Crocosphaera sp. UHCC 0190]